MNQPSVRANILTRRSYNRPLNEEGTLFETFPQTIGRVRKHQTWLWEEAQGGPLTALQLAEMDELEHLLLSRVVSVAGRTLWLGGTELIKRRPASSYNCCMLEVRSIHDLVDAFWLLLQGCLPPDTPVLTEEGPKPIADVKVGDRVWSYNETSQKTEMKAVLATHDVHVPREENVKLNCRYGSVVTSRKHPVLVLRDDKWCYVPAGAVKLGDFVRKAAFTSKPRQDVPDEAKARAWFAGAFLGDGSSNLTESSSRRVRMSGDNKEVIEKFARVAGVLSGECHLVKTVADERYHVPMWQTEKTLPASNRLVKGWGELVGDLPSSKTFVTGVPAWVKGAYAPPVLCSFLAGLIDTDGTVTANKVHIATSSKVLVDDLLALCPVYGMYPWLTVIEPKQYTGNGYKPTAPMYRLNFTIQDLRDCVGELAHPVKKLRMQDYLASSKPRRKTLLIPHENISKEIEYLELDKEPCKYNFTYQVEDHGSCDSGWYVSRGKSYSHLLQYDQVIGIETELDIDPNFKDLTVADNHSYLCGHGSYYVLHNCGVGFKPTNGSLSGFTRRMEVQVIRSTRKDRGRDDTKETFDQSTKVWTIQIGDSAEAWAKSIGKIVAGKFPAKKLVLDLTEIRPGGTRLRGYGWISSGDAALSIALSAICAIMNQRAGKLLSKIDILDIVNWLGTVLSSRRSAEIALMDYGDSEWYSFATAKAPKVLKDKWHRGQSNNTLLFWDKPSQKQLKDVFEMMVEHGGAEPGIANAQQMKARAPWAMGFNPCVTGDTLVAVADGRGHVPIKELADKDLDVPVYCLNDEGELDVRIMRHPRQTGAKVKILKLVFRHESGEGPEESIRVTENHKFLTREGVYKEAKDLKTDDSLVVMHRYVPRNVTGKKDSYTNRYISLATQGKVYIEHRLIARHYYGKDSTPDVHLHHIDGDRFNNDPKNLEFRNAGDHLSEHSAEDENPTYSGHSHEEIVEHGMSLTEELGRRFTGPEWVEYAKTNNLPQSFSKWRQQALGTLQAFANRCALEVGIHPELITSDNRVVESYRKLTGQGYECTVEGGKLFVKGECEECHRPFCLPYRYREVRFCTPRCGTIHRNKQGRSAKAKDKVTATFDVRRQQNREAQVKVYLGCQVQNGSPPDKKQWVAACKTAGVTAEICRDSSPFKSWAELQEAAKNFNHRVVAIEDAGHEDVYTGTVDDFHNFFVGGWENKTKFGREKFTYLNSPQCGEILLSNRGVCNLVEIDVAQYKDDHIGLHHAARLISRANYRQTIVNMRDGILQDSWHQNNEFLRLCGVGLTGIARRPDLTPYDYRQLRHCAVAAAYSMADELGLERPKNVTCVKPSGCRPGNGLVTTDEGIFTLNELLRDHSLEKTWCETTTPLHVTRSDGKPSERIAKTFRNGETPVLTITMRGGLSVQSTADHPWFVTKRYPVGERGAPITLNQIPHHMIRPVMKWVNASDLREGDVLELVPGIYKSTTHATIVSNFEHDRITFPAKVNADVAWLLGFALVCDVPANEKHAVGLLYGKRRSLEKAKRILKDHFGLPANVEMYGKNKFFLECQHQAKVREWLAEQGACVGNGVQQLPRVVRTSAVEDIVACIAGCFDALGASINYSVSPTDGLSVHIQDVAWTVGLTLSRHKGALALMGQKDMEGTGGLLKQHSLELQPLADEALLSDTRIRARHDLSIDFGVVVRVEEAVPRETFDVEIEGEPWYYAGCVRSHNTLSKAIFDTTEGAHRPLAKHILNNVVFNQYDPLVSRLAAANYKVVPHPDDGGAVLVTIPVPCYDDVSFDVYNGRYVDKESAVSQLERYKMLQNNYVDQNTSITVSYDPTEVKSIVDWLTKNWDNDFVATSFLFRADVDKTAEDLGFKYLPQEVVTQEVYEEYNSNLKHVDIDDVGFVDTPLVDDCASGACPIR